MCWHAIQLSAVWRTWLVFLFIYFNILNRKRLKVKRIELAHYYSFRTHFIQFALVVAWINILWYFMENTYCNHNSINMPKGSWETLPYSSTFSTHSSCDCLLCHMIISLLRSYTAQRRNEASKASPHNVNSILKHTGFSSQSFLLWRFRLPEGPPC